jgi:AraC-like DNA-binding protein
MPATHSVAYDRGDHPYVSRLQLMSELTLGAGLVRGLLDFVATKGASPAALAAEAGIDPADLEDPDRRIAFEAYVALMRRAKAATGDPALALHFGEAVDIADLSIVALLGRGETPVEALAAFNRFSRLVVEVDAGGGDRYEIARRDGRLWMVDRRPDPNAFPELTESSFARMVTAGRRAGMDLLREVHVTHKAPPWRAEYERIFAVPVMFESEWNALQVDDAVLSARSIPQPAYVQRVLHERAEVLLAELDRAKTLSARVEALLEPLLPGGGAGIAAVAARLGLSRQTLYRRLKAEGTTFEALLDGLRHRLALRQLEAGASIGEIAWQLGFSDRAAFSRAFKRWTGKGPGARRGG